MEVASVLQFTGTQGDLGNPVDGTWVGKSVARFKLAQEVRSSRIHIKGRTGDIPSPASNSCFKVHTATSVLEMDVNIFA